jgi:hypothetical protein
MTVYAYIKLETNEYPLFQGDIRLQHPEMGEQFICPNTYTEVYETEPPTDLPEGKALAETYPVQIDGKWVRNYHYINKLILGNVSGNATQEQTKIFATKITGRIPVHIID